MELIDRLFAPFMFGILDTLSTTNNTLYATSYNWSSTPAVPIVNPTDFAPNIIFPNELGINPFQIHNINYKFLGIWEMFDEIALDIYDQQMIELGSSIHKERTNFLKELTPCNHSFHSDYIKQFFVPIFYSNRNLTTFFIFSSIV